MPSSSRIVARRQGFSGWNKLTIATVETVGEDGKPERHDREIVDHGHAGVVLTIDRARGVAVLVRQLRAPLLDLGVEPYLLEACAGIIDPGEAPEETARREAEEEIGMQIGALRHVASVFPSAGTLTEQMHLYIAEISAADRTGAGGGVEGEGEDIEVVEVAIDELFDMARTGRILDAKTLILVQKLMIEDLESRIHQAGQ